MSHKSRFLVGLASAVITFSTLFATLGQDKFNCGRPMCHPHHQHSCIDACNHHDASCEKDNTADEKVVEDSVK